MFEMQYEKTPTHSKEKPNYAAKLVWDTLYLELGSITKGETLTEFGPMPCWIYEPSNGTGLGFKRKTLGGIKDELEQGLFQEIQKSRGLSAQPMPVAAKTPEPDPTEPVQEVGEAPAKSGRLFGRRGE